MLSIHSWTMAGLMMMLQTKDFTFKNAGADEPHRGAGAGYHSRIDKSTEKGFLGYYGCYLYDEDVKAEKSRILIYLLFPAE